MNSDTNDIVVKITLEEKKEKKKMLNLQRLEKNKLVYESLSEHRKEKALKGMRYLKGLSEQYSDFFKDIIKDDKKPAGGVLKERNKLQPTASDLKEANKLVVRGKKNIKTEDVTKKLKYFSGGKLHPYQVTGVKWMTVLFENGLNGILADEMGLGKTIQVIALICHLYERKVDGPYLIVVPLSTIPHWKSEFEKFAPKIPVVVFHGNKHEKKELHQLIKNFYDVGGTSVSPVVIVSYQGPLFEFNFLQKFTWQYIIVDEGHRIKNHQSKLALSLRDLQSLNRLLLTGTPLQNNITELWALLNFLLPHIFNNKDTFESLFLLDDVKDINKILDEEKKNKVISTIHKVLGPFMLRRLKTEVLDDDVPKREVLVYCPMSDMQKDLYNYIIDKNIAKLTHTKEDELQNILTQTRPKRKCTLKRPLNYYETTTAEDLKENFEDTEEFLREQQKETDVKITKKHAKFIYRLTMLNTMIMFRKVVNHPYLVHFPLDPNSEEKQLLIDENLVKESGKILALDAILPKLKEDGHKILLFSTFVIMLDILEEFLIMRNYNYRRLDGSVQLTKREKSIEEFNTDPNVFIFLISTRAGGLGLNLVAADTVIFYDRDWNPQADIQAAARCHRIGQTKPVMVYTLVTKNTIDDTIILRGHLKRRLEKLVITDGKLKNLNADDKSQVEKDLVELRKMINSDENKNQITFSTSEVEKLLDRSDLYEALKKRA